VHETAEDLARLQELLDRSYEHAGGHLRSIMIPERRVGARELAHRLSGMRLLSVATVTADGRPMVGALDGIFFRGAFHFGTAASSVRYRHLLARPAVSATYLPAEEFGVTVHGVAVPIDVRAPEGAALRDTLLEVYVPRYGTGYVDFIDYGFLGSEGVGTGPEPPRPPVYMRIDADRLFALQIGGS
jgi:hypothetical protein